MHVVAMIPSAAVDQAIIVVAASVFGILPAQGSLGFPFPAVVKFFVKGQIFRSDGHRRVEGRIILENHIDLPNVECPGCIVQTQISAGASSSAEGSSVVNFCLLDGLCDSTGTHAFGSAKGQLSHQGGDKRLCRRERVAIIATAPGFGAFDKNK